MNASCDTSELLLSVRNLNVRFGGQPTDRAAVDGISFDLARNEVVCLVGESGSGKSATAFAIMRLLPPNSVLSADRLSFEGRPLLTLTERDMCQLRGNDIALIFQEPMTALNPSMKVGNQIAESLVLHRKLGKGRAWREAVGWMERVGVADAARRAHAYPHELSGGMRQRVMIALACCLSPSLIIADEPTTALDVTVQAQVLELLFEIQAHTGSAVLFITHDLAVVAEIADRVIVMQRGRIVEEGDVRSIFKNPRHPYTRTLLKAVSSMMESSGKES